MSRTVPFDEDAICDECGKKGSYDFMGDYLCQECCDKFIPKEYDDYQSTTEDDL